MKVNEFIEKLQNLDGEKNIFFSTFDMCDDFVINEITSDTIQSGFINKLSQENVWDYAIQESSEWLDKNS